MTDFSSKVVIPAPAALAQATEDGMLAKAQKPWFEMFMLSLSGGAFIALGFIFFVTSQQGLAAPFPVGPAKVLGGLTFSVGLMLVVVSGSDLFTGTTMTTMPLLSGRLSVDRWLGHWGVSILGNFVGAVIVALLVFAAGTPSTNKSAWGLVVLNATLGKVSLTWGHAFFLGILANFAVCLAVWMANSGRSTADKILACAGPIALFVASGFEHSVANMFMLPMGWLIKNFAPEAFWQGDAITGAGKTAADFDAITAGAILTHNLIPVILGNIVGGAIFVGAYFWICYVRPARRAAAVEAAAATVDTEATQGR